jgi:ankyrin repeat protein
MSSVLRIPKPEWDGILSAAQKNDSDRIRDMARDGVDPNYANAVGQTALHIASLWGNGRFAKKDKFP